MALLQHRIADAVHLRAERGAAHRAPVHRRPGAAHSGPRQTQSQASSTSRGTWRSRPRPRRRRRRARRKAGTRRAADSERRQDRNGWSPSSARPDDIGGDAGQHHRAEGLGGEAAQDQFHREEWAGERGVEGRRDAGGRTAGDQQPHSFGVQAQDAGRASNRRRTDLHDRALTPDRTAAADAQRRRQRLDQADLRGDPAAAMADGEHHLRHAVTARLAGEPMHQRPVHSARDDGASSRNQKPSHGQCVLATRPSPE